MTNISSRSCLFRSPSLAGPRNPKIKLAEYDRPLLFQRITFPLVCRKRVLEYHAVPGAIVTFKSAHYQTTS